MEFCCLYTYLGRAVEVVCVGSFPRLHTFPAEVVSTLALHATAQITIITHT